MSIQTMSDEITLATNYKAMLSYSTAIGSNKNNLKNVIAQIEVSPVYIANASTDELAQVASLKALANS